MPGSTSSPNAVLRNNFHLRRPFSSFERWLLQRVFKVIGPVPIRLVLRDGEGVSPPGTSPLATVWIRDRRTLARLIFDPEMAFGEAYSEGRVRVEGDLVRLLEAVYEGWAKANAGSGWYHRLTSQCMRVWQANSFHGSRKNIHRHYDLGNDFYKLWLDDPQLVYTCAYFPSPSATLEDAQEAKLDYICRKLRLQRGETVAEAGCGWGALALHMARSCGVRVKAFNVSHEQILYARRRAAEAGLSSQVEFIEDDYRNITGKFNAFVSVGMLEHVGLEHYADLGAVIHRAVGDTGRGLLHFIGRSYQSEFSRWIRKRIFPGAYAPTLPQAMSVLEPWNYSVLDVENLRPHYAKTVELWLDRFNHSAGQISNMYGEWFERAWRLYLAGSIAGFRTGTLQLFQIVFAGSRCEPISWTRAPLYAGEAQARAKWTHAMS